MTFTIDACIVIAVVNKFDFFHERSKGLLERRRDDLVVSLSVLVEAIETYVRKFNEVLAEILVICNKALDSSDFVQTFMKDFQTLRISESQKNKNLVNFYDYIFSLIKPHVESGEFKEIGHELQDHSIDLAILIPARVSSIKAITEIVYPGQEIDVKRKNIEFVISGVDFPKGPDKNHFLILCAYSDNRELDYFTTDGRYFLRMIESLNLIRKNESFRNIGLNPWHLTEDYIKNLQ